MAEVDPSHWTVDQVLDQLCSWESNLYQDQLPQIKRNVDLEALANAVRSNDLDGETLLSLKDANVKEDLGINSLGQRRELMKVVQYLREISTVFTESHSSKGLKRPLESEDEEDTDRTTPELRPGNKKRRIQPELLSSRPINAPTDFDPDGLTEIEQAFLERHQQASDEESLRPYNESDSELEVMSNDSLLGDLESEDETPQPKLPSEEIYRVVDDVIEEYRQSWVASKQPKKYKTAFKRWMSAAKAGTRKPQQNALQTQITTLQTRLVKLRKVIYDANRESHKVEDIKQGCANLQLTVETIAEQQYYLEMLESNHPPPEPPSLPPPVQTVPDDLAEDEEVLESESDSDVPEGEDILLDEVSHSGSDVSLMYDLTDNDWNPQIPPESSPKKIEFQIATEDYIDVPLETQMEGVAVQAITPPHQTTSSRDSYSPVHHQLLPQPRLVRTKNVLPTLPKDRQETSNLLQVVQNSIEDQLEEEPEIDILEERLPQSRYRSQGATIANAIDLGSSPASSEFSMTNSVHTPPLNPETPTKRTDPRKPLSPRFPAIQETRSMKYKEIGDDVFMLLCKSVYKRSREVARDVLEKIKDQNTTQKVVSQLRATLAEWQDTVGEDDSMEEFENEPEYVWTYFFIVFATGSHARQLCDISEESLDQAYERAPLLGAKFDKVLRPLLDFYIQTETEPNQGSHHNKASKPGQQGRWMKHTTAGVNGQPITLSTFANEPRRSSTPLTDTESDMDLAPPSSQQRKRPVHQSQEALRRQRDDRERVEAQEEQRRQLMMQRFQAVTGDENVASIPINTEEPIVYLDKHIARRVKPHQIEGIQFIWRELVADPMHQGCLLAHTMGLGKTMQVVSFLVTLAQANLHSDWRKHLPLHLRSNKFLIVCPASLVDNWSDEILMWTPPGKDILGTIYRIHGTRKQKIDTVKAWNRTSGVLIVGYESLRAMLRKARDVSDEDYQYLEKSLLKDPCVVVADEAHKLKNTKSAVNKVAMQVATSSRIALTGSPLNNHLEEYHTMINWIAPNYLGTLTQFKAKYSEPIERGLYADSSRYDKRKSLEKLYVLKRDLAPKISRKDISAIAKDMPQKTEFFITVPLTGLQRRIYTTMVEHILKSVGADGDHARKSTNAQLWAWLSILSWLCNHPSCLIRKLEEKDPEGAAAANASLSNLENLDDDEFDESTLPDNFNVTESSLSGLLPLFLTYFKDIDRFNHREDPSLSTRSMVTQLLIEESVAQGDKILIFSHSIPTLDFLQGMVGDMGHDCMRIDGSTKTDQRQNATKFFNDEDSSASIFLISTRAGGLGLNLQGANRVIIYDFGFNPSWEEQAIGRAYRLGQKKPVYVYRFRAGGTFEETMYNKAIFKTQLFSRVVDQKNVIRHASKKIEDYLFVPKEAEKQDLSECLGKDSLLDQIVQQIPDAIRGLILTETFQREDEEDEMTPEEKKAADEAYRMEQLARSHPKEYLQALAVRDQAQRIERMQNQQALTGFGTQKITFEQAWNPSTLSAAGPTPRPTQQAMNEGRENLESQSLSSKESSTAPSCRNQ